MYVYCVGLGAISGRLSPLWRHADDCAGWVQGWEEGWWVWTGEDGGMCVKGCLWCGLIDGWFRVVWWFLWQRVLEARMTHDVPWWDRQ